MLTPIQNLRKSQINGFRLICFLGLFFFHYNPDNYFAAGHGPVGLFVLSGFVITHTLLDYSGTSFKKILLHFYASRAFRLLPLRFFIFFLLLLTQHAIWPNWYLFDLLNVRLFLASITHLNEMIQHAPEAAENGIHLWCVDAEIQFYIIAPFLLLMVPNNNRIKVIIGCILSSYLYIFLFNKFFPNIFYGTLILGYGGWMSVGSLIYCLYDKYKNFIFKPIHSYIMIILGIIILLSIAPLNGSHDLATHPGFHPSPSLLTSTVGDGLIILGLWLSDQTLFAKFLSLKPISYLGKISYGLYSFHFFSFPIFAWLSTKYSTLQVVNPALGSFALTVFVSVLSWHFFELPILNFRQNYLGAKLKPQ